MTVAELIAHLQTLPLTHTVVVDLHSECTKAAVPSLLVGYDNGGYISRAYREEQQLRSHGYVYIGPTYGEE